MLTSYYGNTITYDAIGNPLSWGDYGELTWQGRRLESYTDSESEETFTYTYNSDGIRTSKTIDGVEHIYHLDGTQILSEEWTENGVQHLLIYIYDASGAPIGMAYRDSTYVSGAFDFYLFAKNVQGDILYIYNTSGTRLVTYTYDAWGNVTTSYSNGGASTAARYNPFRYRGYYYDTETGFYYLNSRYYDPELGRFLNADGYINGNGDLIGYNMFAYCGNNPVMFVDPSGETYNDAYYSDRSDNLLRRFFGVAAFAIASTAVVLYTAQVAYTRVDTLPGSIGISSVPKSQYREVAVDDAGEKDITVPPSSPTVIYRYHGTNPGNLTPSQRDVDLYLINGRGLSFSTIPKPGAAMTTIEALNATGIVYAVQDGPYHVSVYPVGGTIEDWHNAGSSSIWTAAVKSVVVKWKEVK